MTKLHNQVRINVYVTTELRDQLTQAARVAGCSRTRFALQCLVNGVVDPVPVARKLYITELMDKGYGVDVAHSQALLKYPDMKNAPFATKPAAQDPVLSSLVAWNKSHQPNTNGPSE